MTNLQGAFRSLSLSLPLLLTSGAAMALPPSSPAGSLTVAAASETVPESVLETPATAPTTAFEAYTHADLFSIQLPAGWVVSQPSETLPLIITNFPLATPDRPVQPEDIRTEITWIEKPPSEVVPPVLQEIQAKGYSLADYGALTIDNTTALQLWLVELPEMPSKALMTYIGYENGTAVIVSRFDAATPAMEQQLMTVHGSFTRL